jgi:hypothetical protein
MELNEEKQLDIIIADTLSEHNKLTTQQWYKLLKLPKELTKKKTELEVNNELEYQLMSDNLKLVLVIEKLLNDNNQYNEMQFGLMNKYESKEEGQE